MIVLPAGAETFVETFDNGSGVGGWSFHDVRQRHVLTGGNPGAFFGVVDGTYGASMWDVPSTIGTSIFTGDYRAKGVTSIGIDLRIFGVTSYPPGFQLEETVGLVLQTDNGTPDNTDDDWALYNHGTDLTPEIAGGWRSYEFGIPSQSASIPEGWGVASFNLPPSGETPTWTELMGNVSQVWFTLRNADLFWFADDGHVGLDNARISYVPEPASAALMLLGLIVAGCRGRLIRQQ